MKKREPPIKYTPLPANWLIKEGNRYYKRLMPVPWLWMPTDLKKVRELLQKPVK